MIPRGQHLEDPKAEERLSWFFRSRLLLLAAGGTIGLLVLAAALFNEQIRQGEKHREKISRQSIRRIRIPARRGFIFSRDLRILAGNRGGCALYFYPEEMRIGGSRTRTIDCMVSIAMVISHAIGRNCPLTRQSVASHLNLRPGLPITAFSDLSMFEAARALEVSRMLRGVELAETSFREYPAGNETFHLVGYVRSDSPSTAPDREEFFYYIPDLEGKTGLEKAFDQPPRAENRELRFTGLRGLPGYSLVQVDHLGFIRQTLIEKIEPNHGTHLVSTLDSRAQKIAASLLKFRTGAMVLLNADNGDVLAACSSPAPDLADFSPAIGRTRYRELLQDPRRPLINRAFCGIYPPGSILKPLVALAFIDGGIDPKAVVHCDGGSRIGDAAIRCAAWRRGGHGALDLAGALTHSCNDYMIENGIKTGLEPIREVLRSAGIGRKTGIELPEAAGILPDRQLKVRQGRGKWNNYDTALLSMGQGLIALTPLQAAVYTAALANGGTIYRPHLGWKMVDVFGNTLYERRVEVLGQLKASPKALEIVRSGMFSVVESPDGSGRLAKVDGLRIAGKTGSAEVGPRSRRHLITWFIAFTEYGGQRYALAVMVENGSSGGRECAPLAAELFRRYLLTGEGGQK